ncbi:MAG TPA: hypothetical protein VK335_15690 [Bryobacteraceae bacterium]|nr:hypothetical protein [Bryobacteraceae bacterium]
MAKCAESRLALIEAAQNADGGWGYFPGKESWLEPTAYALLALTGEPRARPALERAGCLVRSWEVRSGGWRACARVAEAHWATSLMVTLHSALGIYDGATRRGVDWLISTRGAETRAVSRLAHWLSPRTVEFDAALSGWPWQAGTSSWVEPTAHALMALGRVSRLGEHAGLEGRIAMGHAMLLERRCRDGGWNYGNRRVLGADLPSQPETTALALMALDGHPEIRWGEMLDRVERLWRQTASPLARAWLGACLLQYRGERPQLPEPNPTGDILVNAVEAIPWNRILAAS